MPLPPLATRLPPLATRLPPSLPTALPTERRLLVSRRPLQTRVATDAYASVERKDVLLLLGQALHAADISNPTKPRALMMRWTERVMKEFWQQGDKEKSLRLPISAFMDRAQPQVPQCQIGFVNVLVKPLFVEWHKLLGETALPAITELENSLKIWTEEGSTPCESWDKEDFVR